MPNRNQKLIPLKLIAKMPPYNEGEIAGFTPERAQQMIKDKIAVKANLKEAATEK